MVRKSRSSECSEDW